MSYEGQHSPDHTRVKTSHLDASEQESRATIVASLIICYSLQNMV